MQRKKDAESRIKDYLVDIVPRFFDVRHALEALESVVNLEKRQLITHGQSFAYQQGILDVVRELKEYAAGMRNLEEETEELREAMKMAASYKGDGIYQ